MSEKHDDISVMIYPKGYKISVLRKFLDECPTPDAFRVSDLIVKYDMRSYVHNAAGPAVTRLKDNRQEYWMNGILLDVENPELAQKIKSEYEFKNKLEEHLKD